MNNNKLTLNKSESPQISNGVNKIFQAKWFKVAVYAIAVIIIFLIGFKAGTFVGFRKADFSYHWAENYHRNFAGPRDGFMAPLMTDKGYLSPHATFGKIIKIELPTIIIQSQNEAEKSALIKDDTNIRRLNEIIKGADLKVADQVVIIGEPNNSGQIEAKLIRIMPSFSAGGPASPASSTPQGFFPMMQKMRPR